MSWKVQDDGFAMTLSSAVPDLIQSHLRSWVENWLSSLGLRPEDIEAWAIHPGGAKIVEAVKQSLDLSDFAVSHSLAVLQEFGNMSSPTILFILEKIRASLGCVPTVVLAFGPGLTIEAAYLSPSKQ
jgi:predicted naringenin-chalcone synthase